MRLGVGTNVLFVGLLLFIVYLFFIPFVHPISTATVLFWSYRLLVVKLSVCLSLCVSCLVSLFRLLSLVHVLFMFISHIDKLFLLCRYIARISLSATVFPDASSLVHVWFLVVPRTSFRRSTFNITTRHGNHNVFVVVVVVVGGGVSVDSCANGMPAGRVVDGSSIRSSWPSSDPTTPGIAYTRVQVRLASWLGW